jgi:hypothetical protein
MAQLQDYLNIVQACIPTYGTLPINAVITQVNLARRRIISWGDITRNIATYTLTAGTSTYPFSTILPNINLLSIIEIQLWLGNIKYPLQKIQLDQYSYPYNAYPVAYWLTSNSITFYPTPSQAYNIDIIYTKLPTDLVNATDVDNDIPDNYRQIVGYLSASNVALLDTNVQLSQIYQQMAQQLMQEINTNRW